MFEGATIVNYVRALMTLPEVKSVRILTRNLVVFSSRFWGTNSECPVHRISGKLNTGRPPRQYYPDPRGNHTRAAGGIRIFESSARGSETCAAFQTLIWGEPSNRLSRNDPLSDSGTVGETGTVVPKRMGVIRSSKNDHSI